MQDQLNSSLDSIELEIYHKPNPKISSILKYLRSSNVKFCTDPTIKQKNYDDNPIDSNKELQISNNKFINRKEIISLRSYDLE